MLLGYVKAFCAIGLLGLSAAGPTKRAPTAENTWQALNPGWNLGNTLDAIPDETSWGNPLTTPALIDAIKKSGFKSIRVPVTWADHFVSASPSYTVNATWFARVEEIIDLVLSRNLYAVLNVHHDSWQWADFANPDEDSEEKFVALWEQIAERFKDKSHLLILEPLNEPVGETQEDAEALNHINQVFVDIVRGSGGKNTDRLLTIPGLNTNIQRTVDWFVEPTNAQPYIIHVHDYDPWDFVSTSWGRTFWGTPEDKQAIEDTFIALSTKFQAPGLIGEWGLTGQSIERGYAWVFFDHMVRTARKYKLATQLWDNGFDHFDRFNMKWRDPVKAAIITNAAAGVANALPAYNQLANLFVPANSTSNPAAIDINLVFNDRRVADIYNAANKKLAKNTDYTVTDAGITINPVYLKTVDLSQNGKRDTLTVKFNRGANLPFDIVVYSPVTAPQTSITVTSTASPLVIQVDNGGSQIATVKAVKADGAYLKDDWTQYLGPLQQGRINWGDFEYNADGNVVLSTSILQLVQQSGGAVDFTLEFWPREAGNDVAVSVSVAA